MATFREVLRRFRAVDAGATWQEFARAAAKTDEGRRALAAWQRSRRLLAFPSAKRQMLASLLARHSDARTIVFTADNATGQLAAKGLSRAAGRHGIETK